MLLIGHGPVTVPDVVEPPPPSLAVGVAPGSRSVVQGSTATVTVTVTRTSYSADVTLSATSLPSGVTASFSPATLSAGATTATLTLTAAADAVVESADLVTITASGSGVTDATTTVAVTVTAAVIPAAIAFTTPFHVTAIVRGLTVSRVFTLTRTSYTGDVTLSASGLPTGITASWSLPVLSGGAVTSTLTLTADGAAPLATDATVTLTASGAGVASAADTLTLTVFDSSGLNHVYRPATIASELPRGLTADCDVMMDEATQTVTTRDGTGEFLWRWRQGLHGSARHAAIATTGVTVTITNTGAAGWVDFKAALVDFTGSVGDWEIKLPASIQMDLFSYDYLSCLVLPDADTSRRLWVTAGHGTLPTAGVMPSTAAIAACSIMYGPPDNAFSWGMISVPSPNSVRVTWTGIKFEPLNRIYYGGIFVIRRDPTGVTGLADYPTGQIIDRCWLSGDSTGETCSHGLKINGYANTILETWITGIRDEGAEPHACVAWTASRHNYFRNVFFEGNGMGVLFGGADPDLGNSGLLDPADSFFHNCASSKKPEWLAVNANFKNHLEMKNAQRMLFLNILCNRMANSSQNAAFVLNNNPQFWGNVEAQIVADIVVHNFVAKECFVGIGLSARTVSDGGAQSTQEAQRLAFTNGRFANLGKCWPGYGTEQRGCPLVAGGAFQGLMIDQLTWWNDASSGEFDGDIVIQGIALPADGKASDVTLTNWAGPFRRIFINDVGVVQNGLPALARWSDSMLFAGHAWYGLPSVQDYYGDYVSAGLTSYATAADMGFNTTTGNLGAPGSGVGYGGKSPGCVTARLDALETDMAWGFSR